jgi:hypothetical protein
MQQPKIYADFNNADPAGRIRLNCVGTQQDLSRHKIVLEEGLSITLYADDVDESGNVDELRATGIVQHSSDEQIWVAVIDWSAIHHASDESDGGSFHDFPTRQVG